MLEADNVFGKMLGEGLAPSLVTYTMLFDGICRASAIDLAYKVLDKMVKQGCSPNVYAYSALIYGLCREGKLEEAKMFIDKMKEKYLQPNQVTYTSLIDGNVKSGKVDHAFDLLSKMINEGCQPNYRTYCELLNGIVQENKIQKEHLIPDEDAVGSSDPDNLDEIHDLDGIPLEINSVLAFKLLDKMMEKHFQPTVDTYSALIAGLCKSRKLADKKYVRERPMSQ